MTREGKHRAGARLRSAVRLHQGIKWREGGPAFWLPAVGFPCLTGVFGVLTALQLSGRAESFAWGFLAGSLCVGLTWWITAIAGLLALGADRQRKGAQGEEATALALRPLERRGWRVVHDIEVPGKGNVDHLLIGPGGVYAIDSKYTTERLWVTPRAIGGSTSSFMTRAKRSGLLARQVLDAAGGADVPITPALAFWGPGAPKIDGGCMEIQGVLVLEGRQAKHWRAHLQSIVHVLDREAVTRIARSLRTEFGEWTLHV